MVARREKVHPVLSRRVDQAMLLIDATGPLRTEFASKRFEFARPGKRVAKHILHEPKGP